MLHKVCGLLAQMGGRTFFSKKKNLLQLSLRGRCGRVPGAADSDLL